MRKLFLSIVLCGLILFGSSVNAEFEKFDFAEHTFYPHSFFNNPNVDIGNRYAARGFEVPDKLDFISLGYAKIGFYPKEAYTALLDYFTSSGAAVGMKKQSKNKYAFSYLYQESNGIYVYGIVRFEDNHIAGSETNQLLMNLPEKMDIAILDQKYFSKFYKAKLPAVLDKNRNEVPHSYCLNFNNSSYILKYTAASGGDATNYYLPKKETFEKYSKRINVNYRTDRITSDKIIESIINSDQYADGYQFIDEVKIGDAHIFSYLIDMYDLSYKKDYKMYYIYKFQPYQKGVKCLAVEILFDKNTENLNQQIEQTIATYGEYIKTFEIPEPVMDTFGHLPVQNAYNKVIRGLH